MAEKEVSEALFKLRTEVEKLEQGHPELRNKLEGLLEKLENRFELAPMVSTCNWSMRSRKPSDGLKSSTRQLQRSWPSFFRF